MKGGMEGSAGRIQRGVWKLGLGVMDAMSANACAGACVCVC